MEEWGLSGGEGRWRGVRRTSRDTERRRTDRGGLLRWLGVCVCSAKYTRPDAAKWLLCIVSNLHLHNIVKKVNFLQFRNT